MSNLAGLEQKSNQVDGLNIWSILKENKKLSQREILWQLGEHAELKRKGWLALRQGPWKYIQDPAQPPQLFNIQEDPYEKSDLAKSKPDLLEQMAKRAAKLAGEYRNSN